MDTSAALAALDHDLRRDLPALDDHAVVERTPHVTRHVDERPRGWSGVVWSDLDATTADAVVAEEVARFRVLPGDCEWKHYHHDRFRTLPVHLVAAGLRPGQVEAVMVAEAAAVPGVAPPAGVSLVPVRDAAGVEAVVRVHEAAFGAPFGWLGERLLEQLVESPSRLDVLLAVADGVPVSAARTEYYPGTAFAGLWGGGTLPGWRRRGVYRALVSHRAELARARGVRYLHVDALPTSRPILERLGFVELTSTTPYTLPE
ncbi:GNAT family N-acetyltransferase [Actinokineospora spheciospongiae]|uniref:GNAT family N-acetyltransferase n=1 Tax=Actinokineospora spheciospongiae TaxID=909613 RepID=UPI000D70E9A8|nr:GNAT family N-acetyltransferase [Actinokineospora spheciospongiae]PWW52242.1 hypothetical protein DFQ13_11834 [Actinokineospora spheciospongiae]